MPSRQETTLCKCLLYGDFNTLYLQPGVLGAVGTDETAQVRFRGRDGDGSTQGKVLVLLHGSAGEIQVFRVCGLSSVVVRQLIAIFRID